MAAVTLPLTFQNSFWTQDYRRGLEVLFAQLEKGAVENDEIIAFIKTRAAAETAYAVAVTAPVPSKAFDEEADGASLHLAFRGLKDEAQAEGKLHADAAKELQTKIVEPFSQWAGGYKERLHTTKAGIVDGYLRAYENAQGDISGLKNIYVTKMHKADEMEDDVRFAPITQPAGETYTSPNLVPRDKRAQPRAPVRQPTMSERITARLKEFRLTASPAGSTHSESEPPAKAEVQFDADAEEKGDSTPKVDKGKGRALDDGEPVLASPPPLSPPLPPARLATNPVPAPPAPPVVVAGISFAAQDLSDLLARAKAQLPLRAVRFPLLGEYQDAFTGEEFTAWLRDNVEVLKGNLDRAEDAARELTQKHGLLRRLGELGNEYENSDDAFYQFRPKAFNLEVPKPRDDKGISPLKENLTPIAENVVKRTANFASLVTKALNTGSTGEAPYVRARREAEAADHEYKTAVRNLDRQRLGLEERVEDTLKKLQLWELERLRAVKTVLLQYQGCMESLSKGIAPSLERSSTLIAAYQPESDLRAIIEQYRTGPFRPTAHVYDSLSHDDSDVVFGLDLRKWADSGYWNGAQEERKDALPPVLLTLLGTLTETYPKLPNDAERRKTWIYDVPLVAVHHLRETLNAVPAMQELPDDTLSKYDAPVIASAVKLWLLELDPPLCLYECWDEFRKLYPIVGSVKSEEQYSEEQRLQDLQTALQKLPRVHILVLDALIKHLRDLVSSTFVEDEPAEVYVSKLSLALGRAILRPKTENKFSLQDRHPIALFADLLQKYDGIIPPALAKKKRESERKVPQRKRTRPMDMRMSRSRISAGADLKELHAQQLAQRGLKARSPPPVPALPSVYTQGSHAEHGGSTASSPSVTVTDESSSIPQAPVIPPPPPITSAPLDFSRIPPPPPLKTPSPQPQPPVVAPKPVPADGRPQFREPPPEDDDDYPPRPQFQEPRGDSPPMHNPHAHDHEGSQEYAASPHGSPSVVMPNHVVTMPNSRPNFVEPPPEPQSPPVVSPRSNFSRPETPGSGSERDPSPVKASISRRSSLTPSTGAAAARGPRPATRGPRTSGGSVSSLVNNFQSRTSPVGGASAARPSSPGMGGRSPSRPTATHVKRSSASRTSLFERRTMASDAEDEVVQ